MRADSTACARVPTRAMDATSWRRDIYEKSRAITRDIALASFAYCPAIPESKDISTVSSLPWSRLKKLILSCLRALRYSCSEIPVACHFVHKLFTSPFVILLDTGRVAPWTANHQLVSQTSWRSSPSAPSAQKPRSFVTQHLPNAQTAGQT